MLNINGYPVLLSDTAGIRKDQVKDLVEKEGIRRSVNEALEANLLLLVFDVQEVFKNVNGISSNENILHALSSYITNYQQSLSIDEIVTHTRHIIIGNKWDLLNSNQQHILQRNNSLKFIGISCKSQYGIQELLQMMTEQFVKM